MKYYYVSVETMMVYTDDPKEATSINSEKEAKKQARKDLVKMLQNGRVNFSVEVEEGIE